MDYSSLLSRVTQVVTRAGELLVAEWQRPSVKSATKSISSLKAPRGAGRMFWVQILYRDLNQQLVGGSVGRGGGRI